MQTPESSFYYLIAIGAPTIRHIASESIEINLPNVPPGGSFEIALAAAGIPVQYVTCPRTSPSCALLHLNSNTNYSITAAICRGPPQLCSDPSPVLLAVTRLGGKDACTTEQIYLFICVSIISPQIRVILMFY